jgi:hypothetical protein
MCATQVTRHTSNIYSCQKKLFLFSCSCEKFHQVRSSGFLVINVCNHGEHYETPCINFTCMIVSPRWQNQNALIGYDML